MKQKLTVIVGLGKTGLSCLRYLAKTETALAVIDNRQQPPGLAELQADFPNIPFFLGEFDQTLCQTADLLIVSPGVSLQAPAIAAAIQNKVTVIGDIELFARQVSAPVIAITGSNGKSTVTTLVGEMARCANLAVEVGGNLGTPALDLLNNPSAELFVVELSSFQLETTHSLKPVSAVVLNISEDHMDRYQDLTEYLTAKQRIYQHCHYPVINRDDPLTWQNLTEVRQNPHTVSFGLDEPQAKHFGLRQTDQGEYLAYGENLLIASAALKIKGRHQIANALAALALGHAAGLPMPAMLQALRTFSGLAHRCQWVAHYQGVDWYNDSKATNVGAAQASIDGIGASIQGRLHVIAGGMGKNADFSPLRTAITNYVETLILIGQDAEKMATALTGSTTIMYADSLKDAVLIAQQRAQANDTVLLAPACASLDMFDNFEQRGDAFISAVRALHL